MRSVLFTLSSVTACFGIVAACTHDFDTFEGEVGEGGASSGADGAASSSTSSGAVSSTSTSSGSTTSSGGGSSATPGVDANVDCQAVSGSCFTQAQTCNQKCGSDQTTCSAACPNGGPGNKCRADCVTKQTTCAGACKRTCEQCAGPQCRNLCP